MREEKERKEKHERKKKGQTTLNELPMAVILLAVMIISLAVMSTVMLKVQKAQDTFSTVTTNDTTTVVAGSVNLTYTLSGTGVRQKDFAVTGAYNKTPGAVLATTSYTFTYTSGSTATFKLTNATYNISAITVVYTNSASNSPLAYNITGQGLQGAKTFSDFLDPIAVIIAAVIIIGLILGAFVFARRGSGASGV